MLSSELENEQAINFLSLDVLKQAQPYTAVIVEQVKLGYLWSPFLPICRTI